MGCKLEAEAEIERLRNFILAIDVERVISAGQIGRPGHEQFDQAPAIPLPPLNRVYNQTSEMKAARFTKLELTKSEQIVTLVDHDKGRLVARPQLINQEIDRKWIGHLGTTPETGRL